MNERENAPLAGVVISGGASGLGAATALAVKKAGGKPIVFDLKPPAFDCIFRRVDITDGAAVEAAVTEATAHHVVNALVCCAGIDHPGPFDRVPAEKWAAVINVNVNGTAIMVRALQDALKKNNGRLVVVGSTMGLRSFKDATAYCTSKFALVGFTRALAQEVAGQIGVTLIMPSGMNTPFFASWPDEHSPPRIGEFIAPEVVADAIVFALTRPAGTAVRELVITAQADQTFS